MKITIYLILIFFVIELTAIDLTHWTQFAANYFSTNANENIEIFTGESGAEEIIEPDAEFGYKLQHETSGRINQNFSFSIQEEVFFSQKSQELRNSFLFNDARLKLFYQSKNHFLKLQYSNRFYEHDNTLFLASPSLQKEMQQQMVHNTYLLYKGTFSKFDLSLLSSVRNLDYEYAEINQNNTEELTSDTSWDNDWISNFVAGYRISEAIRFFGKVYFKDDLNESDFYDHWQTGAGIEYNKRFDFFNSLSARFSYLNNQSDAIAAAREHYMLTEARFTKRFNNGIAGFISYLNRSCYDQENSELLRIANVVKLHLKYSYFTLNTQDSFILAGIKLNPENESNLVLAELNQFLIDDLYLNIGAKYAPELLSQYAGKIEYMITPLKSIWLKAEYTDFSKRSAQNIVSAGTTLIF